MRPNVLRPKDRSLRGGKLVKLFTDYHALERVLSRISTANPPEGTVKRLSDALVQELDFTTANAWAYAKTVLKRHSTDSPACVAANAAKLTGDWLGMTQSGVAVWSATWNRPATSGTSVLISRSSFARKSIAATCRRSDPGFPPTRRRSASLACGRPATKRRTSSK
jgi:hypothetical protein